MKNKFLALIIGTGILRATSFTAFDSMETI